MPPAGGGPSLWPENVEGDSALAWVESRDGAAMAELQAHPCFASLQQDLLGIFTSDDRRPRGVDWIQ